MIKSSFYVHVHTGQNYTPDEYNAAAGTLLQMFQETVSENCTEVLKGEVTGMSTDVEVCLAPTDDSWELVLKAVVDLEGDKAQIDKTKLSSLLRAHKLNEWGKQLKVEKRAVPKEILQAEEADAEATSAALDAVKST